MSDGAGTILYSVFRSLRDAGLKLGVADYLHALQALRLELSGAISGGGAITRERLRRICHILWARSTDESRIIDAVFRTIPASSAEEVRAFEQAFGTIAREGTDAFPLDARAGLPETHAQVGPSVKVDFEASRENAGIPLPSLVRPVASAHRFIMQPQTVISERALAVLWRRFRKLTRAGPKTELDLDRTIEERCRQGVLAGPLMRAPRNNRAQLLILLDASPSMAPWQPFLDAVARSLTHSRLYRPGLFHFRNLPRRVYRPAAPSGGLLLGDLFPKYRGASMLIVSDAGAARGFLNHRRVRDTQDCLRDAQRRARAVVWVNPMPRQRWAGTTAERLGRSGTATFLPLDITNLIRAVDILRGARSS
jgi:uncharacterized protein with von Willebrand factor type A (vWA) domain